MFGFFKTYVLTNLLGCEYSSCNLRVVDGMYIPYQGQRDPSPARQTGKFVDKLVDGFLLACVSCLSFYGPARSCTGSEGSWRQLDTTSKENINYLFIHISPMQDQPKEKAVDFLSVSMGE